MTESQLLAHCIERLADFKRPNHIHITDAIPRTATGKIERRAVAAGVPPRYRRAIVIVGAGAIGGYVGARFAGPARTSCLLPRPAFRAIRGPRPARCRAPTRDFTVSPARSR